MCDKMCDEETANNKVINKDIKDVICVYYLMYIFSNYEKKSKSNYIYVIKYI